MMTKTSQPVKFLTVAEVARIVRVSPMTIYRMVARGELTAIRVGRSYRLPAGPVREYLDELGLGEEEVPRWLSATASATPP